MKLAVSNIGFDLEYSDQILELMKEKKFHGLEIAPTLFIGNNPYEKMEEASKKALEILNRYHIEIVSMQSIWYGKKGNIFCKEDQEELIEYTKSAIDFAKNIQCKNLVFGCPKNRIMGQNQSKEFVNDFFKILGDYAKEKEIILAIEPNPSIYGTNFLNSTKETFDFVKQVHSDGLRVNIDMGTIIENKESLEILRENFKLINHIHISEPYLAKIKKRDEHKLLFAILKEMHYENYLSIEMKKTEDINDLIESIKYAEEIFHG